MPSNANKTVTRNHLTHDLVRRLYLGIKFSVNVDPLVLPIELGNHMMLLVIGNFFLPMPVVNSATGVKNDKIVISKLIVTHAKAEKLASIP